MNISVSVDDEVVRLARRRAASLGTSVNQLVREYLEQLARGQSHGWKFNREELHAGR